MSIRNVVNGWAGLVGVMAMVGGMCFFGCARTTQIEEARQPVSQKPPESTITDEDKEALLAAIERQVKDRAYAAGVDFTKWPDHIKKYQSEIDRAATMNQFTRAVNRALNEFGISHIDLMSPSMAKMQSETSFGGIGITPEYTKEGVKINGIRTGGPADKAGLKEGDVIIEVDGKSPVDQGMIRGVVGTELTIKYRRKSEDADAGEKTDSVTLKRAKISYIMPPRIVKVGEDAAVIRLDSFSEEYDRKTVEKVFREAKDVPMLVIDLRSNGGGAVVNLYHFLSMLLPKGSEVGTFINRSMARRFEDETKGDDKDPTKVAEWSEKKVRIRSNPVPAYGGKIAVLIDGGTASASEITAAAMRELKDAPLIGTNSAGAVLMSTYVPMKGGFQMKIPTSDYVTIKGLRIEGNPLEPDMRLGRRFMRMNQDASKDEAVIKAIELLRTKPDPKKDEEKPGEE